MRTSSEIHPLVARRRKSDSDISYSPSKDSSLEKDEKPMVHASKLEYIRRKLGFTGAVSNCSQKIWMFWAEEVGCTVQRDHHQCLHVRIAFPWLPFSFQTSFIYAKCTKTERRHLWDCLRNVATDMQEPWLVGGDFNTILSREERLFGAEPNAGSMEEFATALFDCGLMDAGFEGNKFTWTNTHMFQRLDRVVYNMEWASSFSHTRIHHLNRDGFDHCPLLISCCNFSLQRPSSFRFLHAWVKHHGFLNFVANNWRQTIYSTGLMAFWNKQQRLKKSLKGWNKDVFGDIFSNLRAAEKTAEEKELTYQHDSSVFNRTQLQYAYAKLNNQMQKKRVRNSIFKIQDSEGTLMEEPGLIESSAVEFFENLLKAENYDLSRFKAEFIPQMLSDADNNLLCAEPQLQEVKDAVFAIDKDSVVGPDGFSSFFYQQCWPIIAEDLLAAVRDFFKGAVFPRGVTSTTLVLLAKKPDAATWSDFRPISLCTILNKIVTKLLANRLSKVLPSLISENQSGFVSGRLINDNILLAQELIGKIDYKARGGNVVLKLDMMKAYDRLNWDFLILVLERFGFNDMWIDMIRRCITNCWFSVLINGHSAGYFKSERGLRQGDSISPMLFILAAEYLSRGINELFSRYISLHYHSGCSLNISHLAFADDIMIFTNGSKSVLEKILEFLQEYEQISGQRVNHQKSCFVTANNMPSSRRQIISQTIGFLHKTLPITYLGAPLFKGPKKVMLFDSLINKIRERITGWENKILSPGGRITLLRSVLSSMPIYLLQVLKPPACVIQKIERLFNSFLWGSSMDSTRIHWTAWHNITFPSSEGGLGIRSLKDSFDAFSAKLWWRFDTCQSLWVRYMRLKYCTGQIHHNIAPKPHDSATWKPLLAGRATASQQIRWRIGKGDIFFWHDAWMGDEPLVNSFPSFSQSMMKVNYFFNDDAWDVDKLKTFIPNAIVEEILKIPISREKEDIAYWALTANGDFSIKSAWELLRQRKQVNLVGQLIWHKSIPLTVSFFLWRTLHNWLPVEVRMKAKGIQLASKCLCCKSEESLLHVLWESPVAQQVWNYFSKFFQIYVHNPQNILQILNSWYYSGDFTKPGHIRTLILLFIFWFVWVERNDAKHRDLGMYPDRIIWRIMKILRKLFQGGLLCKWQWKGDLDIAIHWGFNFAQERQARPKIINWIKPLIGELKLNVDGSSKDEFQNAAGGGVLRDHTGNLIFGFSENFGYQNSLQAELLALHRGLCLCMEYNVSRVWIEVDAQVVIQMIQNHHKGSYKIQYLLESIRKCLQVISVRISHIHREGNQAADFLSKHGHTHQNLHVFTEAQGELRGRTLVNRVEHPRCLPELRPGSKPGLDLEPESFYGFKAIVHSLPRTFRA
ncbi:Retrotransposon, unclassified-like protein [Theobroma cacao]|uniref:Retrotransposon, unclassified-like protein n=1 Tax=Theobroma cacao TaxID=3641 RepID=A0A061FPJ7_THECC|nr:Retrotransposon, unclassified-like protein [Theobroma cacao]